MDFTFSEQQMGFAFEGVLTSKKDSSRIWLPAFDSVFKEIPSVQGIPDYIGVEMIGSGQFNRRMAMIDKPYLSSASSILAFTNKNAYRTEDYYVSKTGLTKKTVRKTLLHLISRNIIVQDSKKRKYVFAKDFSIPNINLWAFELKLDNWKRAYFQATQYRSFANYSIIVFPHDKEKSISLHKEKFMKMNIGVLFFNPLLGTYKVLCRAKKSTPQSKRDALYVLGQLLTSYRNKERVR